jgi:hypothetical protein
MKAKGGLDNMPTLTLTLNYDGTDADIMQALGRMVAAFGANGKNSSQISNGSSTGWPDRVAPKFAGYVSQAAASGHRSQQAVMEAWLKPHGTIDLNDLVKVSGVAKTHDFAGVGSSLTRNMIKAGGPKKWYEEHRDVNGKRIRRISDELVEPLKRAFRV